MPDSGKIVCNVQLNETLSLSVVDRIEAAVSGEY